eukprot:15437228-Alexandrium_andersonii.AAC.1
MEAAAASSATSQVRLAEAGHLVGLRSELHAPPEEDDAEMNEASTPVELIPTSSTLTSDREGLFL